MARRACPHKFRGRDGCSALTAARRLPTPLPLRAWLEHGPRAPRGPGLTAVMNRAGLVPVAGGVFGWRAVGAGLRWWPEPGRRSRGAQIGVLTVERPCSNPLEPARVDSEHPRMTAGVSFCLLHYRPRSGAGIPTPTAVRRRAEGGACSTRGLVGERRPQPALGLLDGLTLAPRVVFDLVAADRADGEV